MRKAALLLCSLLIAACASSPPVRYFVLDPVAPAAELAPLAAPAMQIAAVRLPATLDRRQIVREVAPNKLLISNDNRWGAPLPDMTQRVLSQDLMLRLPSNQTVLAEEPAPNGTGSITVEVLQFCVVSGNVVLDGSWTITHGEDDHTPQRHTFHLSEAAPNTDFAQDAHIMSALLGSLADSMAQTLRRPAEMPHGP
jgi:uncharacterized protein